MHVTGFIMNDSCECLFILILTILSPNIFTIYSLDVINNRVQIDLFHYFTIQSQSLPKTKLLKDFFLIEIKAEIKEKSN